MTTSNKLNKNNRGYCMNCCRSNVSFLVLTFCAVFGVIILCEVFFIEGLREYSEKSSIHKEESNQESVLSPTAPKLSVLEPTQISAMKATAAAKLPMLKPTTAAKLPVLKPTQISALKPTAAKRPVLTPTEISALKPTAAKLPMLKPTQISALKPTAAAKLPVLKPTQISALKPTAVAKLPVLKPTEVAKLKPTTMKIPALKATTAKLPVLKPTAAANLSVLKLKPTELAIPKPAAAKATCPPPVDGQWQPVNGTKNKFLVYSAFYETRVYRMIRVIGATKTASKNKVWCRYWYSDKDKTNNSNGKQGSTPEIVEAHVQTIRENWGLMYSACYIFCPLPITNTNASSKHAVHDLPVPYSVAVVADRKIWPPTNHLLVRNSKAELLDESKQNPTTYGRDLAVCVKPLHYDYNKFLAILEFLELYTLLGVKHFIMYNHTVGPQVNCILKDYVRRGTLTLLPWELPMVSQVEIRTEGLFAALNDCVYRTMYRYGFAALVDLDEYIIPRHNDTLPELLASLEQPGTKSHGSFSFQNAFFYMQWPDDTTTPNIPNLITQRKTRRKASLHPHRQRSKYICKPELVVEAGNHFIWEYVPGITAMNVRSEAAILHHYRVCEFGGDDCVKAASVIDRTALKYGVRLRESVLKRWEQLHKVCKLPPLK